MKASAKDLRFHSKELLDTVNRGEEVVITFRGKPCARLIPYENDMKDANDRKLFGLWKNNKMFEDVDGYVRRMRRGRF